MYVTQDQVDLKQVGWVVVKSEKSDLKTKSYLRSRYHAHARVSYTLARQQLASQTLIIPPFYRLRKPRPTSDLDPSDLSSYISESQTEVVRQCQTSHDQAAAHSREGRGQG